MLLEEGEDRLGQPFFMAPEEVVVEPSAFQAAWTAQPVKPLLQWLDFRSEVVFRSDQQKRTSQRREGLIIVGADRGGNQNQWATRPGVRGQERAAETIANSDQGCAFAHHFLEELTVLTRSSWYADSSLI